MHDPTADRLAAPAGNDIAALIRQARSGSREALGALLDGCRKYLLMSANRALDSDLRPKASASDLVQDAFVEVQRGFARFSGTTESELLAWLSRILANRLNYHARFHRHTDKRSVNREIALELVQDQAAAGVCPHPTPDALAADAEEERRLNLAMSRLTHPMQQVLMLRTWERRGFSEIGSIMNRSAEAARKLWGRAVQRLGEELSEIP